MSSGLSASTTSRLAILPRPVMRPTSGRPFSPVGARPADEQVGRERVEKNGRRRSGRKDALDPRLDRDRPPPGCEQDGRENHNKRAPVPGRHTPIMTSDALMTAQASSPVLRLRSAAASFVIADVMTTPTPMWIRTWDVVVPFFDFEDLALELITRAQLLHGSLLSKIRCYGRCRSAPSAVSARSPSAAQNNNHL